MAERHGSGKKQASRMIALIIAGVMVFSVVAAAVLSQVW